MRLVQMIVIYAALYSAAYAPLYALFAFFFAGRVRWPGAREAMRALAWILAALVIALALSASAPEWWGNRIQHALGGGAVAMLMCFFAARSAKLSLPPLTWLVFSLLVVTALGVGNELVESVFQVLWDFPFATSVEDTWLDLWSNALGALGAGVLLAPALRPAMGVAAAPASPPRASR